MEMMIRRNNPKWNKRVIQYLHQIYFRLSRLNSNIPIFFILSILISILILSLIVLVIEVFYARETGTEVSITSVGEALWWAVVTLTTVGYGDYSPISPFSRLIAIIMMGAGIFFSATISGVIASIMVEKRLTEGKGLKEVKVKNHVVICGWNEQANSIIKYLPEVAERELTIVLINELDEETFNEIKFLHKNTDLRFVHGNFTNEAVLKRANIESAISAIILSDISGGVKIQNTDERTILGVLAIKSICPEVKVCAQANRPESVEHLQRANVDDVIVDGEFNSFLIGNSIVSPGVPAMVRELLDINVGQTIKRVDIPKNFVGKTFDELSQFFRKKNNSLLIGIITEDKEITLDELLGDGMSAIDEFIKRKFKEAEEDYFKEEKPELKVKLNPDPGYLITDCDLAYVITGQLT